MHDEKFTSDVPTNVFPLTYFHFSHALVASKLVVGASKLGWIGEIEDGDSETSHAVGELGRLDPAYRRAERIRMQARSVAESAFDLEDVLEKVFSLQ